MINNLASRYIANFNSANRVNTTPATSTRNVQSTANASATTDNQTPAAERYDFTHMTPRQLHETINHLIKTGQMTFDESTTLLFTAAPMDKNGNLVDYDKPINVIERVKSFIEGAQSRGETDNAERYTRTLNILQRLQR